MKLKRNDFILLAGVLFIALCILLGYHFFYQKKGEFVQIAVNGKIIQTFPLSENRTYTIHGVNNGTNTLQIKDGFASIIKANCPDKICVHQKKISKEGESLVCLPHKVIVSIISNKKATLDGVA